jgi:mannosyltransferase OCH1-like enzyme
MKIVLFSTFCIFCSVGYAAYYLPFDEAMVVTRYAQVIAADQHISHFGVTGKVLFDFFYDLYERNSFIQIPLDSHVHIPKIIHQIWIGSTVPEQFKKFQKSWQFNHPDWDYHLWTQEDIAMLHLQNADLIAKSHNPGEISDIMRYEILYRFGGVFLDMDFECLNPLDELHYRYDFYIGIQPLDSGLVQLGIGIIGSIPGHPLLKRVIEELRANYHNPLLHNNAPARTGPLFFTKLFFMYASSTPELRDIALPAWYCYPLGCTDELPMSEAWQQAGVFGIHHWAKSWLLPAFRKKEFQELDNE